MEPAFAVWLTGLPASGKTTIARALVHALSAQGIVAVRLESDVLRAILMPRAGYSDDDRAAFYAAFANLGVLLVSQGVPVIFDATANRRAYRARGRSGIDRFLEVFVETPLQTCVARDPKGLYGRAREGSLHAMPGIQAEYEPPECPDLVVSGCREAPGEAAGAIVRALEARGWTTGVVCA